MNRRPVERERADITRLPAQRRKNGCFYELVKRTERTAMYSQRYGVRMPINGFEVFMIRILRPSNKPGALVRRIRPQEKFPANEDFGRTAWTWCSREAAERCFDKLEKRQEDLNEA